MTAAEPISLFSLDAFDTLFLRSTETERFRSDALATRLSRSVGGVGDVEWGKARSIADRACYRLLLSDGVEEPSHGLILSMQVAALGLPPVQVDRLRREETENEVSFLRPNLALAERARKARDAGAQIAIVSDMYLSAESILDIHRKLGLDEILPLSREDVYTSGDRGLTKRSGRLFDAVIADRPLPPRLCLHIGDDPLADVEMPRARGWRAEWLPRSLPFRVIRTLRSLSRHGLGLPL